MKKHKSRTLYSLFGIMLTIILCFSALTVGYSVWDYNLKVLYEHNGETQLFITNSTFTKETLEQLNNYASVKTLRILDIYSEAENPIPIEEANENTEYRLEIGLWDTSNLQKSVQELKEHLDIECNIDENVAMYLNQGDDNLSANLYHVCVVMIASLFAVFSIFVLRNTMMLSIVERMKDYGLLRCIGMSKKQLYELLLTEGLIMGICAVIGGVACGYGLLIGLQPWINHEFYFSIPFQFGFYPKAILYTTLLCIAVTLFSLLEPARQSGMISPIEAIHNNITLKNRKGGIKEKLQHHSGKVWGFFFGVEGEYAYKNMMRSRGRFIYLFVGLIASVVLLGSISSFADSTYAFVENIYQGQQKEYTEIISVNAEYRSGLVQKILSDLKNIDGVTEEGLILSRYDFQLFDSNLMKNNIEICINYGYDKDHFNQLKSYLLEGEISFEKMEKEHGVILCDTKYNDKDAEGNEIDYRLTDYKVGDTISLLSSKGANEAAQVYEDALQTAGKKLGIESVKTQKEDTSMENDIEYDNTELALDENIEDAKGLEYYSKEDDDFNELLQETLRILKKKGFDCESIQKLSEYENMNDVKNVLLQLEYNQGEKDEYVIQGIISEDIYNGGYAAGMVNTIIAILHPDTEILTNFVPETYESYVFPSFNYSWAIGFNRDIHQLNNAIEEYCKLQTKNGTTYTYYSELLEEEGYKDMIDILHTSRILALLISGCIALISMIQVFNTVCANMTLRKKELEIFSVVGMSRKQERKMIILENGVAAILAVIIGYLLAWSISWYFVDHLLNQDGTIHYIWPWFKMIIAGIILIIATGIVSILGMGRKK